MLKRRELGYPETCVLCDQEEETVQHILSNCVFARQFWHTIPSPIGLSAVVPKRSDTCFVDWWTGASSKNPEGKKKGIQQCCHPGSLELLET